MLGKKGYSSTDVWSLGFCRQKIAKKNSSGQIPKLFVLFDNLKFECVWIVFFAFFYPEKTTSV